MIVLLVVLLIGFWIRASYKRNLRNRRQRIYFNAILAGEEFTEAQHKQIRHWLND